MADGIVAFVAFVLYAALAGAFWYLRTGDAFTVMAPVFYLYNLLLLLAGAALYTAYGEVWVRVTVYAVVASVLLQLLLLPFSFHPGRFRQTLFFNNPNQLGYFGLLAASIVGVGSRVIRISPPIQLLGIAGAGLLTVLSLSKAGMLALLILVMVLLMHRPLAMVAAGIAGIAGAWAMRDTMNLLNAVQRRLTGGATDETLAARGYDRLANHVELLLFGAGEGDTQRFESMLPGELHSTWGTIVFSYGFLGSLLFAVALFLVVRRGGLEWALLLLPAALYGLTHQGLRFSLFWVFLTILLIGGNVLRRRRECGVEARLF
jgi:hypothetical protein